MGANQAGQAGGKGDRGGDAGGWQAGSTPWSNSSGTPGRRDNWHIALLLYRNDKNQIR